MGVDSFTKFLAHCDGTNGGTTFTDSTGNGHNLTASSVTTSTTQIKFGTTAAFFGSSGTASLNADGSSDFAFGAGDFTVDFWVFLTANTGTQFLYDSRPTGTNGVYPVIYLNGTGLALFVSSADRIAGAAYPAANTWTHIALTRASGSSRLFMGGVQQGSTFTDSNSYLNGVSRPAIGSNGTALTSGGIMGYMDEIRVSNGVARWTTTFTPPTTPYGPADLTATAGSYTLTGKAANVGRLYRLTLSAGSYALTGAAITFRRGINISAAAGSYAITGATTTFKRAMNLSLGAGAYALTGAPATRKHGFHVAAGAYALTGATLIEAAKAAGQQTIRGANYVLQKLRVTDPTLDQ